MLAVFNKEFKSYFTSPIGYIFMVVFLFVSGIFFAMTNLVPGSSYYAPVLDSVSFVFLILVPMLTMRTLSEEKSQRTDQLLLTSPLKLHQIVIGKYLAAVSIFLITLLVTVLFPLILSRFGKVAGMEILGYYIGFALMGSAFIAVGLFISSLTENQISSAIGTFGALLFLWLLSWMQQGIPTGTTAGFVLAVLLVILVAAALHGAAKNIYLSGITAIIGIGAVIVSYLTKKEIYDSFTVNFLGWFSILKRYDNFSIGVLDVSAIVYYITFSAAFIFFAIRMLEKRRWS